MITKWKHLLSPQQYSQRSWIFYGSLGPLQKPTHTLTHTKRHTHTHRNASLVLELTGHPPVNKPREDALRHKQAHNTSFLKPQTFMKHWNRVCVHLHAPTHRHTEAFCFDKHSYETLTKYIPIVLLWNIQVLVQTDTCPPLILYSHGQSLYGRSPGGSSATSASTNVLLNPKLAYWLFWGKDSGSDRLISSTEMCPVTSSIPVKDCTRDCYMVHSISNCPTFQAPTFHKYHFHFVGKWTLLLSWDVLAKGTFF